jgi:phosphate transport system ATP-binding protein
MASVYDIDLGGRDPAMEVQDLSVLFGAREVVKDVSLVVPQKRVVALLGPSGCGKSTLLKCLNRMNDLNPEAKVSGRVFLQGEDIYGASVDPVDVRRRVGMVFQRPCPFPKSVFENVAFGPVVNGMQGDLNHLVEDALKKAALWAEVNDRLDESATKLSSGQQQRLCIARALAVGPEILLMDEPASELDPWASQGIEELILALREDYTIVIVTHHLQQAARVSDFTAFLDEGELVEYGPTGALFTNPRERKTEAFVTGRLS